MRDSIKDHIQTGREKLADVNCHGTHRNDSPFHASRNQSEGGPFRDAPHKKVDDHDSGDDLVEAFLSRSSSRGGAVL
ncbi:hypothetical protein L596_023706 [Steinernema carpocapsae]|uniref:Uncharacterized protein n=1 Tax=Steinernema carpocapsae TaxID=34508 RepID=A0A4U5MEI4_STECR|nr:hypothetical protein L596_023706 [Steinernema carpocapsae]